MHVLQNVLAAFLLINILKDLRLRFSHLKVLSLCLLRHNLRRATSIRLKTTSNPAKSPLT